MPTCRFASLFHVGLGQDEGNSLYGVVDRGQHDLQLLSPNVFSASGQITEFAENGARPGRAPRYSFQLFTQISNHYALATAVMCLNGITHREKVTFIT